MEAPQRGGPGASLPESGSPAVKPTDGSLGGAAGPASDSPPRSVGQTTGVPLPAPRRHYRRDFERAMKARATINS